MGTDNPKRQHYVPQLLLNNFCDCEGYLWVGDREKGKTWKTRPRNVFVGTELYTERVRDPNTGDLPGKNYKFDKAIQKLEGAVGPVVKEIIKKARSKQCPELSQNDSDVFKRFIYSMAGRTPESQQRLMSSKSFKDGYYEIAKEWAKKLNQPLPDKDSVYQDLNRVIQTQKRQRNVNAQFAASDDIRLLREEKKFCGENCLWIGVIEVPKRSFVIGSHGITIFKMNRDEQSCLPIAHDVVVLALESPDPDRETLAILGRDQDWFIRKVNSATANQSRWIAGCSEQLIRSLMTRRQNTEAGD